jgi:TonB family protein
MSKPLISLPCAPCLLLLAALCVAQPLQAQTASPAAAAASAAESGAAPNERLQRQVDNVYRWIKLQSDKPRKTGDAKTPAAATPTPAPEIKATPKSAAAAPPKSTATPDAKTKAAVAEPVAPAAPTPAPVVAKAPEPPPPVVEEEIHLKVISQAEPVLPRDFRAAGVSGSVTIEFTVRPDGSVSQPEVIKTSSRRLNAAVLDAVSTWRFEPIRAPYHTQVEFAFNID